MEKPNKSYLNLLFIIFILFGIAYTLIEPLIPLISEKLAIGYDKIGLILFVSSSVSFAAVFISGRLSDKFDLKKIILTGLAILVLGFFIYGIIFSLAVLIATIILFKAGGGILDSSIHACIAKLFPVKQSHLFIKLDFFWYIGAIAGPLIISVILFLKINTQYVFLFFACFTLIITLLFLKFSGYLKKRISVDKSLKFQHSNTGQVKSFKQREQQLKKPFKPYSRILKNPLIICCCAGLFFYMGIISILSTWLTAYFKGLGVGLSYGSILLSAFWAFNALGVILTGKILLKTNEASLLLLLSIFSTASSFIYSLVPITYIKIIFLIMQAVSYSGFFALLNSLAVKEEPDLSGTILGITISVAVFSQIIFQPLNGFTMQYFGLAGINYLLMICAAALFASTIFLFKISAKKNGVSFKLPLLK